MGFKVYYGTGDGQVLMRNQCYEATLSTAAIPFLRGFPGLYLTLSEAPFRGLFTSKLLDRLAVLKRKKRMKRPSP